MSGGYGPHGYSYYNQQQMLPYAAIPRVMLPMDLTYQNLQPVAPPPAPDGIYYTQSPVPTPTSYAYYNHIPTATYTATHTASHTASHPVSHTSPHVVLPETPHTAPPPTTCKRDPSRQSPHQQEVPQKAPAAMDTDTQSETGSETVSKADQTTQDESTSEDEDTEYESEPEPVLPEGARRSRRPVERLQIIHMYRGRKSLQSPQTLPVSSKSTKRTRSPKDNVTDSPPLPAKEKITPAKVRKRSSEGNEPVTLNTKTDLTTSIPVAPAVKKEETKVDDKDKANEKSERKKEDDSGEPLTEGRTIGRIVWAKLTARCKAWPAMTIKGTLAAQSTASPDNQWVFWYGEHKVSEVQICRLEDFDTGFKTSFKLGSGALYTTSVMDALADCWHLLNAKDSDSALSGPPTPPPSTPSPSGTPPPSDTPPLIDASPPLPCNSPLIPRRSQPEGLDEYLQWAAETFTSENTVLPHGKVTDAVGMKLAEIVEMINNADESSSDEEEVEKDNSKQKRKSPSSAAANKAVKKVKTVSRESTVSKIKSQEVNIEDACLACGGRAIDPHPLFEGGVCETCMEHVKDSFFSFGADGCMSYCVVCGSGGELLVCDSDTCGRTYCKECIEVFGSEAILSTIQDCDPWSCFLCDDQAKYLSELLLIKPREDWKQRLMRCYQKPSKLHNLPECKPDRKLRVLSLFDGIGTAKVVLDNLNLDLEVYYSVEIEDDAIQVVDLNHGDAVIHLGDIRSLTEEKLSELGRIDLLVGGSPCNDLALVNPARKGLYDATGTGILFFDFYRILMTLMSRQGDSVLWLFENVVHMNKETKETICRFLECEPVKLDAGVFSAQSRSRYFWGNIPGMFCPVSPEMNGLNISLQDMLGRGRSAAVNKIRTVTTRGASLLQGKNEDTHAVVMNGQSDKLWPTELEKIFGLPVHYTDAGNLAPGKRQKLLGRSWCVPVIEYILKPLTHLFAMRKTPRKQCCSSCCCGKGAKPTAS